MKGIEDSSSTQIKESTGIDKVGAYVVNNGFGVPLQMCIFTLIPLQFLYFVNIISTISLLGVFLDLLYRVILKRGLS